MKNSQAREETPGRWPKIPTSPKNRRKNNRIQQFRNYSRIQIVPLSRRYSLTQMFLSPRSVFTSPRTAYLENGWNDARLPLFADNFGPFVLEFLGRRTWLLWNSSRLKGPRRNTSRRFTTRTIVGHADQSYGNPWWWSRIWDQREPVKAVCRGIRLKSERSRQLPFSSSLFAQRALPQPAPVPSPADSGTRKSCRSTLIVHKRQSLAFMSLATQFCNWLLRWLLQK